MSAMQLLKDLGTFGGDDYHIMGSLRKTQAALRDHENVGDSSSRDWGAIQDEWKCLL